MLSILTLKNEKTGEYYDVLKKKTHLVARSGFKGDLEISGDLSVSRSHAEIFITKKKVGGKVNIYLNVVDKKSKFGTFINAGITQNERIDSDRPIILELADKIRFGAMDSIWSVENYPITACPSTLKVAEKDILKKSVTKIGGKVSRDWSDQCTHLCMNSITVTEKVLLCLASAKSIVPIKYFIDLCKALSPDTLSELPFCMDYKPDLIENLLNPNLVSLEVNNERKVLFSGKTFICSTIEQSNRISKIVKAAGGKVLNYFVGNMCDDDILSSNEYIILQQDLHNTNDKNRYQKILDQLKSMNKRPIPENDIGLAIIFSSIENHCNPNYNISLVNLKSQQNVTKLQASFILATETEILSVDNNEISSVNVVPDSFPQTQISVKRPIELVTDSYKIVKSKKRALMSRDEISYNSMKPKVEKNPETFKEDVESIPSYSNRSLQISETKKPIINLSSTNVDSCLTTVPSSQEITMKKKLSPRFQPTVSNNVKNADNFPLEIDDNKTNSCKINMSCVNSYSTTVQCSQDVSCKNNFSDWLQPSVTINTNVNNTNNLHSETYDIKTTSKRKMTSVDSLFDNEDDDPFGYEDIDEIEERTIKKKRNKEYAESLFLPMLTTTSINKSEHLKSVEPKTDDTVDPNFIMNLLATAKGTGHFIDTRSKPLDKSKTNVSEDSEYNYLLNSVIVETVSMVVSKPVLTQNIVDGSNSVLKNFKKFKRKEPAMKIPHIVPLTPN